VHLFVRRLTLLTRLTRLRRELLPALAVVLPAVRRLRRTGALRTAVLRATLLGAAVLLALRGLLRLLLGVTLLAGLRALRPTRLLTLLGPLVLPLRRTVLRRLTTGTWVTGWWVLVGHMLPRWLRWPHHRTCKG
jgi:hypothetical protein